MTKNLLLSYSDVIFALSYNVRYTITILIFSMLYCKRCSLQCVFINTITKITLAEEIYTVMSRMSCILY